MIGREAGSAPRRGSRVLAGYAIGLDITIRGSRIEFPEVLR